MIILECEQGSEEWHAVRLGKVSASRVADIVAKTKTGYSTSRANYAAELVAERLTGSRSDKFVSAEMAWGTEQEPAARALYEMIVKADVVQVGLVLHPSIENACASPDGLVGDDGLVEIKCPLTATHIATLLGGTIPGRYQTQMQWQMACTGRAWCDFVSFDPRMPGDMQIFIERLERDDEHIAELTREVTAFLGEVGATLHALVSKYRREAAE